MSQITIKSPKHCANKQGMKKIERTSKKLWIACSAVFTTILLLILLIFLILHPEKPQFSLEDVSIYQLSLSIPHLINSSIQLTLISNNPNHKIGIYYDEFQVYATYKGQQITVDAFMTPFYQGYEESNLLTASLVGNGIPVDPSIGYEVSRDQIAGRLILNVKVNGRLRWKVGTWVSWHFRFNANCVSVIAFGPSLPVGPLTSKQGSQCSSAI